MSKVICDMCGKGITKYIYRWADYDDYRLFHEKCLNHLVLDSNVRLADKTFIEECLKRKKEEETDGVMK